MSNSQQGEGNQAAENPEKEEIKAVEGNLGEDKGNEQGEN